jgi:hypothetical protein
MNMHAYFHAFMPCEIGHYLRGTSIGHYRMIRKVSGPNAVLIAYRLEFEKTTDVLNRKITSWVGARPIPSLFCIDCHQYFHDRTLQSEQQ